MALLFAWAPRLTFMDDPVRAMSAGGGRSTGGRGRRRAQRALVVSQLAASFMLLIGAGLLMRTLMGLYAVQPGFDLTNVLSLQAPNFAFQNPQNPAQDSARLMQFNKDVLERVKAETSVKNAAVASAAPLAGSFAQQREFRIDGADADALGAGPRTVTRVVSGSYFETIGTPLKAGPHVPTDGYQHVTAGRDPQRVDGEVLLQDRQPDRPAHQLQADQRHHRRRDVVDAGGDRRRRRRLPRRRDRPGADAHDVSTRHAVFAPSTLLVRTAGDTPDALAPRVVETIRALDPNRPIDHVQTLEEIRDETIAPQRLNATLIGLFAGLALVIATVGVAGVLAFSVSQRTNELGIRVALGAQRGEIQRMILGEGAAMAVVGLVIGGVAAIPLSQLLKGLLFGVEPADSATIAVSAVLLIAVALVAAWVPARRATAVDPITALRRL